TTFFYNDPTTPEISTLSLHDALPISAQADAQAFGKLLEDGHVAGDRDTEFHHQLGHLEALDVRQDRVVTSGRPPAAAAPVPPARSEEHTSELQSRGQLVCRLLLEKKK